MSGSDCACCGQEAAVWYPGAGPLAGLAGKDLIIDPELEIVIHRPGVLALIALIIIVPDIAPSLAARVASNPQQRGVIAPDQRAYPAKERMGGSGNGGDANIIFSVFIQQNRGLENENHPTR